MTVITRVGDKTASRKVTVLDIAAEAHCYTETNACSHFSR